MRDEVREDKRSFGYTGTMSFSLFLSLRLVKFEEDPFRDAKKKKKTRHRKISMSMLVVS